MTALEPLLTSGGSAADHVAVLAKVAALKDVIAERETLVRDELEDQVRTLAELAGGQFTGRFDAGMAYIAGGNPKPKVTDVAALADWLADVSPDDAQLVQRVEVVDHAAAADIITFAGTPGSDARERHEALLNLADHCLKVVSEWRVTDGVLDRMVKDGRVAVKDEHLVDTESGEVVPGAAVGYSREGLTVRPDKKFRERVAVELRGQLALPAGGAE